jgi:WD40 repeat protein
MTPELLGSIQVALALTAIILITLVLIAFLFVINKLVESQTRQQLNFSAIESKLREPKSEIETLKSTNTKSATHPKSFGSYSRKDSQYVEFIGIFVKGLGSEFRLDVTHDRGGMKWKTEFERWITESKDFILFWSKNARKSRYVEQEYKFAKDLEKEDFIKIFRWQSIKPPKALKDIQVTYVPLREEQQPDGSIKLICDFKPRLSFIAELPKRHVAALLMLILTLTGLAFYGIRALQKWAFNSEIPRNSRNLSTSSEVGNLKWPSTSEVESSSTPIQSDTQPIPVAVSIPPPSSILPPSINKSLIALSDVEDFSWSPSGSVLLTRNSGGDIELRNGETGRIIGILPIKAISIADNDNRSLWPERGTHLSTVSTSGQVQLWNGETGQEISLRSISGQPVNGDEDWSPSGRVFLTRSSNDQFQLWNGETGQEILLRSISGQPVSVAYEWSPNGKGLLTRDNKLQLHLWHGETGREVAVLPIEVEWVPRDFSWSPNETVLLTKNKNLQLQLWNGETGQEIAVLPIEVDSEDNPHLEFVSSWSPNGRVLVTKSSSGQIQLWNGRTGQEIKALPVKLGSGVTDFSWSPNGKVLVTNSGRGQIQLWNGETGQKIEVLHVESYSLDTGTSWSPNEKVLLTESNDGQLQLWNGETGQEIKALPVKLGSGVTDLSWSPNGRVLVTKSSSGQIQLWNGETGIKITTLPRSVTSLPRSAFSPDGQTLVVGDSNGKTQLRNGETGTIIKALPVKFLPEGYSWSNNGKVLAIRDFFKKQLWIYTFPQRVQ